MQDHVAAHSTFDLHRKQQVDDRADYQTQNLAASSASGAAFSVRPTMRLFSQP
jgi:hypothetical protein